MQFISVQYFILFVYFIISFRIILFPVFDLAELSESMRITKITSDKKYAKLDEDISFTIEYEKWKCLMISRLNHLNVLEKAS